MDAFLGKKTSVLHIYLKIKKQLGTLKVARLAGLFSLFLYVPGVDNTFDISVTRRCAWPLSDVFSY